MLKVLAAAVAAATSVLLYSIVGSASADQPPRSPMVIVHGDAGGVTISRHVVTAGTVRFRVETSNARSGRIIFLLRPIAHVREARLLSDFGEEGSNKRAVAANEDQAQESMDATERNTDSVQP